jgi:hypothetical protein
MLLFLYPTWRIRLARGALVMLVIILNLAITLGLTALLLRNSFLDIVACKTGFTSNRAAEILAYLA